MSMSGSTDVMACRMPSMAADGLSRVRMTRLVQNGVACDVGMKISGGAWSARSRMSPATPTTSNAVSLSPPAIAIIAAGSTSDLPMGLSPGHNFAANA